MGAQAPAVPAITRDTLECAEGLTGDHFADAEIELMLRAVNANRRHIETLRNVKVPPNVDPALRFEPPATARRGRPAARRTSIDVPIGPRPPATTTDDLAFAPVTELAALVRTRRVSSTDLTRLCLERLEKYDSTLHCVITLTRDGALADAARADQEIAAGRYRGPLHGIPYGLKDLVATKGTRTTWGAKPFEHQVPDDDATVYARLREAGAVLVAKLATGELAIDDLWFGGRTRNPWNPELGSGGSSAGPAAATAAGLVPFAIGTETNGSIMQPSSRCGVTGLRPTYGRISRHGVMTLRWSMDKVGVIARSAADCALVLAAVYGPDGLDETAADVAFEWAPNASLAGLCLGVLDSDFADAGTEDENEGGARRRERNAAVRKAIDVLRDAGATLTTFALPTFPASAMYAVAAAEAAAAFDDLVRSGAVTQLANKEAGGRANQLRWARFVPAVDYLRAQRIRTLLIRDMDARLRDVDAFIAPTGGPSMTMTNFTGHPALTINAGFVEGMPVGLMATGRYYEESTLLRIGWAYQQRTDVHRRIPPLRA